MAEQLAHNKSIYVAGIFADTTALKAVDTTDLPQHIWAYLEDDNTGEYYLEFSSSAPESLPDVVAPTTGSGRWIKKASALVSDYSLVKQLTNASLAFINNGNSFNDTATIGTSDNFDLLFKTNNTLQGGITKDGSWLINTATVFGDDPLISIKGKSYEYGTYLLEIQDNGGGVTNYIMGNGRFYSNEYVDAKKGYLVDGSYALRYNNLHGNISLGYSSFNVDTESTADILAIGNGSLNSVASGTSGLTAIGASAMQGATTAGNSVAIGSNSSHDLTTGQYINSIGAWAGRGITTGTDSQFIGAYTNTEKSDIHASTIIGFEAVGLLDNELVFGSNDAPIYNIFFGAGHGVVNQRPNMFNPVYIHSQGDPDNTITDNASTGADLVFRNARAVGAGNAADIIFQYSPKTGSGTTVQSWTNAIVIGGNTGDISMSGNASIVDGNFFYFKGDSSTDGSIRIGMISGALVAQKRVSGTWTTGSTIIS